MAAEKGNVEEFSSQNTAATPPFTGDYVSTKGMTVPETITVKNMPSFGENKPAFPESQMTVPEKIVLTGDVESDRRVNPNGGFQDVGVNYMGGMVTPPRTLTVDDTASRYGERNADKNDVRQEFARPSRKLVGAMGSNTDEDSDPRLQGEIVQLNKRVESLEKKISEKQSSGFWKATIFCLLTIINPIIINYLFSSRRR